MFSLLIIYDRTYYSENKQDQQAYPFLLLLDVRIKINLKFSLTWKSGMCSVPHCSV